VKPDLSNVTKINTGRSF